MMKSLGERKLIFIKSLSFYLLVFFISRNFDTLFNTRQIKFVNFKKRFAQYRRKITSYADMLMMCINLPVHGHM